MEESNSETNVVCIDERAKKYIFDEDMDGFDQDEIIEFVKKFNSGRVLVVKMIIEPCLKSSENFLGI